VFGAAATLTGTVIGAGIFGIPYVIAQAGLLTGLLNIIILGVIMTFVYLYMGEIVLRTKGNHQLTGYAEKYLGKNGKIIMFITIMLSAYGALIAYLMGTGEALATIFGINVLLASTIIFIITGVLIYLGIKEVEGAEALVIPIIIGLTIIISLVAVFHIDLANFTGFYPAKAFIPFGVVLFAMLGAVAIPEMREELLHNLKDLRKAIIIGMFIPIIIYIVFSTAIIGVMGAGTPEIATLGMAEKMGPIMLTIGNLFALFAMLTSFLAVGLAIKEIYNYDFNINKNWSWALAIFIPFIAFLLLRNSTTFTQILNYTGVILGGLSSILIIAMIFEAKKKGDRKPEYSIPINIYVGGLLVALFVLAMVLLLL
jgi:tyrosine-specific transport protein